MAARVGFLAFIAAVLVGLSAIAFPGGSSNGLSSSADPPGFIYVRDQTEIVIVSDASGPVSYTHLTLPTILLV